MTNPSETEQQETLAALEKGIQEFDGLYEALLLVAEVFISTHPQPLALSEGLHAAIEKWEQRRLPVPSPAAAWLHQLRQTADTVAGLEDPDGLARAQRQRAAAVDAHLDDHIGEQFP